MGVSVQQRPNDLDTTWDPEGEFGAGSVTGPNRAALVKRPRSDVERFGWLAAAQNRWKRWKHTRSEQRLRAAVHRICRGGGQCLRSDVDTRHECPWADRVDMALAMSVARATDRTRVF
ncbi:hypothetical protein BIV57_04505 [Mangrovactinospora gilvigrisea]|uniref:Uncharacterized protein n=1 Tax=Mangrovactinospora gilvigrisea TaxID=1428644 RepID=A0A1J7BYV0_9ACTN|nr:hypothetical protein [Mangrovactinospora gilvigrisea]OIV38657.1 hypothetical protein BIV57_04505 [Mangrovactinospora gilvigrisea]